MCKTHSPTLFGLALVLSILPGCDIRGAIERYGAEKVRNSTDEEILDIFRGVNETCPRRDDQFTILEQVKIVNRRNIEYHYTVDERQAKFLKAYDTQTHKESSMSLKKWNPAIREVARRGYVVRHIYRDETGDVLLAYNVDKKSLEAAVERRRKQDEERLKRKREQPANSIRMPLPACQ